MSAQPNCATTTVVEALFLASDLDDLAARADADRDGQFPATVSAVAALLRTCALKLLSEAASVVTPMQFATAPNS